jgi:GNAT superfamily N-acetyltransferase
VIIAQEKAFDLAEVRGLYDSVGWTGYTRDVEQLGRALAGSHLVITARDDDGALLGLARTISDDATICYVQDLLVRPELQGRGVGRSLVEHLVARYSHCRAFLLSTDHASTTDGAKSHAFYRKLGFVPYDDLPLAGFGLPR